MVDIVIIDFGSQTTHLISRRLREMGIVAQIVSPESALVSIQKIKPKGIILSGSPASVYEPNAPTVEKEFFNVHIPILGICYGLQTMAYVMGGSVTQGKRKELGPAFVEVPHNSSPFLTGLPEKFQVWMSHGDEVKRLPKGFKAFGFTSTIPYAIAIDEARSIYGIQFHPEVVHTQYGEQILTNFLTICGLTVKKSKIDSKLITHIVDDIKDSVGEGRAICALSGGVDSSVASVLVHKALGDRLTSIYIDSGLMREGETETLRKVFKQHLHMQVDIVDARDIFLKNLKGIVDPEKKRIVIGNTFIKVLEKEAKRLGATYLVQGTIYPDVIESKGTKHSQKIKSHHNVAGLPEKMNVSLIEPLRMFYKDEVRQVGTIIGLPDEIVRRQPFPGPGLAIRIIGDVTEEKLDILRRADKIVREEIQKAGLDRKIWQAFAVYTGIKTTGVRGDARVYGDTIGIRAIEAKDAMSAHWAHLPYELLDTMSVRIINEVHEVNRVVFDITNKPPATMEWE